MSDGSRQKLASGYFFQRTVIKTTQYYHHHCIMDCDGHHCIQTPRIPYGVEKSGKISRKAQKWGKAALGSIGMSPTVLKRV